MASYGWVALAFVAVLTVLPGGSAALALNIDIEKGLATGWINKTSFVVSTDTASFTAEFKVFTTAGTTVEFTPFTPNFITPCQQGTCFLFGSSLPSVAEPVECGLVDDPLKCVESGYNYTIRLLAAGSQNQTSVGVDTGNPTCTMGALPEVARNPVPLSWTGTDSISGVKETSIQRSSDGITFQQVAIVAGNTLTAELPEGLNYLRCVPRDSAGNTGLPSASETILVDTTPPAQSFIHLPEWVSPFSSQFVFPKAVTVRWEYEGGSCFSLQWSTDNTTFTNVTKAGSFCLDSDSETVGDEPAEPALQDGATYHFRLFAYDIAGNPGPMAYTFTTIDLSPPEVALEKRIGSEVVAGPVLNSSSTSSVTVSITATDIGSGVKQVKLLSRPVPGVGEFKETVCELPCNTIFTLQPVGIKELEVIGQAVDAAGNIRQTPSFFVLRHPLLRLPSGLSLIMGREQTVEVSVRNPQPVADKVTVDVCGSFCPFHFNAIIVEPPGGVVYGVGNTSLNITLPPYSARSFLLVVRPSEVYGGGDLPLLAFGHSDSDPYLDDVDRMDVAVDFPPEFPDMGWWSVLVLVGGSLAVFWKKGEKQLLKG